MNNSRLRELLKKFYILYENGIYKEEFKEFHDSFLESNIDTNNKFLETIRDTEGFIKGLLKESNTSDFSDDDIIYIHLILEICELILSEHIKIDTPLIYPAYMFVDRIKNINRIDDENILPKIIDNCFKKLRNDIDIIENRLVNAHIVNNIYNNPRNYVMGQVVPDNGDIDRKYIIEEINNPENISKSLNNTKGFFVPENEYINQHQDNTRGFFVPENEYINQHQGNTKNFSDMTVEELDKYLNRL